MRTPSDIPDTPIANARHHLLDAFALLARVYDKQEAAVWSAAALAEHESGKRDRDSRRMADAVRKQRRDAEEALRTCERFLWAVLGDPPALAVVGPMIDAARKRAAEAAQPGEASTAVLACDP